MTLPAEKLDNEWNPNDVEPWLARLQSHLYGKKSRTVDQYIHKVEASPSQMSVQNPKLNYFHHQNAYGIQHMCDVVLLTTASLIYLMEFQQ